MKNKNFKMYSKFIVSGINKDFLVLSAYSTSGFLLEKIMAPKKFFYLI